MKVIKHNFILSVMKVVKAMKGMKGIFALRVYGV